MNQEVLPLVESPMVAPRFHDAARQFARLVAEEGAKLAKEPRAAGITFGALFERWFKDYAKPHCKSWKSMRQYYRLYLEEWRDVDAGLMRRQDIQKWHSRLGEQKGHYAANRSIQLMTAVFNRCIEWEFVERNPAANLHHFKEPSRERFMQPSEFPRFFAALSTLRCDATRDAIMMLLWTAVRKTPVLQMRWSEIDFANARWHISATKQKNGRAQAVELLAPAMAILERRRATADGVWVFPAEHAHNRKGHLSKVENAWCELMRKAAIKDLRLHDLRRTLASWQAMTGANISAIASTLNHKDLASTAIYARLNQDGTRQAMVTAVSAMMRMSGLPCLPQEEPKDHILKLEPGFRLDDDELVTEIEAASLVGLSVQYLQKMRHNGKGPPYEKNGSLVRYRRGLLQAWMHRRPMPKAPKSVKLPPAPESIRLPSGGTGPAPFGFKRIGGRWEAVEKEQRVIAYIVSLNKQGKGCGLIAQQLEREGVQGQQGRLKWNSSTVYNIVKRHSEPQPC